ncbi:hypothetical protein LVJ94_26825 [Pendulispora rubella]|uniref:PEGA domain-containing protein n=1 Tax=Pendulispora rubella TaxID=2741070 RepID=A0ABZ2KT88_9BACT
MKCTVAAVVVAAAMLTTRHSSAQGSPAVAEALYREGKRLLELNRIPEACIKFAESQRTDPATGTLLNLANCHQLEGKTASAWAEFTQAAEQAEHKGQTERAKFAQQQATELQKKLRSLVFDVKQPSSGMVVKLDDQVLGNAALGTPLPVDPGEHRVAVSAPNKKTWEYVVKVPASPGTSRVEVPELQSVAADAPPVALNKVDGTGTPGDTGTDGGRRNLGLIVGGAGVLALGTGIFFGVRSVLLDHQADEEEANAKRFEEGPTGNPNVQRQRDASIRDRDDASTNRIVAFIAGGAGLAAVGVGIYFLATTKSSNASAPHASGLRDFRVTPLAGPHVHGASASFAF